MATEEGENIYWEWDVDPMTRKVDVLRKDLLEIRDYIESADELILQNPKFDVGMLLYTFRDYGLKLRWDWSKVRDTLMAGHLLRSNQAHDLTTMALVYLRVNVQPFEDEVKAATVACRRLAQGKSPKFSWRIAKKHSDKDPRPEMPSAKDETWKYDMWLPRYVAHLEGREESDPYWTACSDYANSDSTTTLALMAKMDTLIEQKNLGKIYRERLKVLPTIYKMEDYGITVNTKRLHSLQKEYREESATAGNICKRIAEGYGYDLTLPKSGNNKSLVNFVFSENGLNLPPYEVSKKTNVPSLNARCIDHYLGALPERGKPLSFVRNLSAKRKRDTALTYMTSYERFGIWVGEEWLRLYPSLNPTGTDTLRWSSSNPNEQNISKKEGFNLRYAFGPAPGREWWSCDAKNIELRLPAYESGEQELIDLFERPDEAPYYGSTHLLNFHTVYPDIWKSVLKEVGLEKVGPTCKKRFASSWYQWCKNGGFAVQYGAVEIEGKEGTADRAFHRLGSHARLKSRFSNLTELNNKWVAYANDCGYVETLPDKTVDPDRGYPVYCTRSHHGYVKPTIPLNYHVQSSAMWWMMVSMISCQKYLDDLNSRPGSEGYYMVMQVHDELVFDFPFKPDRGNLPKIKKLNHLMASSGDRFGIPTPVETSYHPNNWSDSC